MLKCATECVVACIPHLPSLSLPPLIYDAVWQYVYVCEWEVERDGEEGERGGRWKCSDSAYL